jgi:hypothetical protein
VPVDVRLPRLRIFVESQLHVQSGPHRAGISHGVRTILSPASQLFDRGAVSDNVQRLPTRRQHERRPALHRHASANSPHLPARLRRRVLWSARSARKRQPHCYGTTHHGGPRVHCYDRRHSTVLDSDTSVSRT